MYVYVNVWSQSKSKARVLVTSHCFQWQYFTSSTAVVQQNAVCWAYLGPLVVSSIQSFQLSIQHVCPPSRVYGGFSSIPNDAKHASAASLWVLDTVVSEKTCGEKQTVQWLTPDRHCLAQQFDPRCTVCPRCTRGNSSQIDGAYVAALYCSLCSFISSWLGFRKVFGRSAKSRKGQTVFSVLSFISKYNVYLGGNIQK